MTDCFVDGVPIVVTSHDDAVESFLTRVTGSHGDAQAHRFVNAFTMVEASRSPEYKQLLQSRGLNLPDGLPLSRWLRVRTGGQAGQVRGPSFFDDALDRGRRFGVRHYFLGGSATTLPLLVQAVEKRYPGVCIVGSQSPPFRLLSSDELSAQDHQIAESAPHVVWVGLGTPKQDFEAQRLVDSVGVNAAAVGAGFDFLAGTKPEAPRWMRRSGLEWLFRLATEPRRLWRRYLIGNVRFLALLWRDWRTSDR